jgi:hypothetical protein
MVEEIKTYRESMKQLQRVYDTMGDLGDKSAYIAGVAHARSNF